MKNNNLLLILLFVTTLSFAQTKFTDGFNTGYKKGYCQDQRVGCIEPIPPISPIPKIGESSSSYTDGYNRGFEMGLNAKKSNSNKRTRYKTAKPEFVDDVMYKSPTNSKVEAIKALDRKQDFNLAYAKILKSKFRLIKKENPKDKLLINTCNEFIEKIEILEEPKYVLVAQDVLTKINKKLNVIETELEKKSKIKESNNNSSLNKNEYFELARNYEAKGEYEKAIFNYSKCLDIDKNNTDALFLRALLKSSLNDRYGAINDYDKIIELEKSATSTYYKMSTVYNNKAYSLIELKKFNEALPFVTKALEMDKTENYIWDTRGELYYNIGEYEKSINDMNEAIKIQKNGNSYYYRGLSYLKIGNKSKACSDLSKAGEMGISNAYIIIKEKCN
jgi:tetratricopeptide (TPR) repeat protein